MTSATKARLPLLLSLAALLLLAVLATRGGSAVPHGNGLVLRAGHAVGYTVSEAPGAAPADRLNGAVAAGLSVTVAITLLAMLVGTVLIVMMLASLRWQRGRRRIHSRGQLGDDDGEGRFAASAVVLLRGARAALQRLHGRAGGPPADAVQQAWLVLEESAAEAGTPRRPDQTSTEFTGAVLTAHDVDPGALATLRGLYQRARFGRSDTVTDADAERAVEALGRIADTLTVQARIGPGTDQDSGRTTVGRT